MLHLYKHWYPLQLTTEILRHTKSRTCGPENAGETCILCYNNKLCELHRKPKHSIHLKLMRLEWEYIVNCGRGRPKKAYIGLDEIRGKLPVRNERIQLRMHRNKWSWEGISCYRLDKRYWIGEKPGRGRIRREWMKERIILQATEKQIFQGKKGTYPKEHTQAKEKHFGSHVINY